MRERREIRFLSSGNWDKAKGLILSLLLRTSSNVTACMHNKERSFNEFPLNRQILIIFWKAHADIKRNMASEIPFMEMKNKRSLMGSRLFAVGRLFIKIGGFSHCSYFLTWFNFTEVVGALIFYLGNAFPGRMLKMILS